jgi:hypothetical protein
MCIAFWEDFFELCQKPNHNIRLFPVDKSYNMIYWTEFYDWYVKRFDLLVEGNESATLAAFENHKPPSPRTFERARKDGRFKDVKKRRSHHHARCVTCKTLAAEAKCGFTDAAKKAEWDQKRRVHQNEVREWRKVEEILKAQARNNPDEVTLFAYDDTEAMYFPHFTNRDYKSMTKIKFPVVPWLLWNYSTNKKDYVYMVKDRWKKGGNRLISQLHAACRRVKSDYKNPKKAYKSRRLVVIGDNFAENKNAEIFAWATEVVQEGWYDSVEFYFGPVGHTHNGVDAEHHIHNNRAGSYTAGDLGQLVYNYK